MTRYLDIKPGSLEEVVKNISDDYQDLFKKELEKTGKSIGQMTDSEKKAFFNKIDKMYNAKNEETINESASQVQVKRDGKGNFNLTFKGKEIGYYHKSGSKYMVYYDNEDGDYNQSDEVSSEMQAKKLAYDNMNEKVDNPYAVGMAAAMKSTGDKPPLKKSTITKAHDIAKSIEKDQKNETHSFVTNKMNQKQKDAGGEKEIVKKEAVDPEQISKMQDKIRTMSSNITKLDKDDPKAKNKEAIMKSDLQTAKLKLRDMMQKKTSDIKKEMVTLKQGYKKFKESLKKENMKDKKKIDSNTTMTDKPTTQVDVEPQLQQPTMR
jgi:hypothetical protein